MTTRGTQSNCLSECNKSVTECVTHPFVPLDLQILKILIREATRAENGGIINWQGMTVGEILRKLGAKSTIENRSGILKALYVLERGKHAYKLGRSPTSAWRWFPSSMVVTAHGFAETLQQKLEDFL